MAANKTMYKDGDYQMAMLLQKQFDLEYNVENPTVDLTYQKKTKQLNNSKSLIDPSWELVDPTPNIYVLFVQFNEKFFWNKLLAVSVSWSKRMTSCAGVCSYQGHGGLCRITISEPLLKLRPRKDLVETLLHEMIHAFLFVTNNDRDRDGHGPQFHKHMYRINAEAGTNITVYHDFHDEVRLYQQHWWRCNGPCQNRSPYFGMVRRAMNRPPGPYDFWWAQHQITCGGTYIKVKEPEKKPKKLKSNDNKNNNSGIMDIRQFVKSSVPGTTALKNKNGTVVLNPKTVTSNKQNKGLNNNNDIVTMKSFTPSTSKAVPVFMGKGHTLVVPLETNKKTTPSNDYNVVRNHWKNKFEPKLQSESESIKKPKLSETSCPNCKQLIPEMEINSHLDNCLNADDSIASEFSNESFTMVECPVCKTFMDEKDLNSHLNECLIDLSEEDNLKRCHICEKMVSETDFTLHAEDCLNKFYDSIEAKYNSDNKSEIVTCLVCNKKVLKANLNEHLEDCMVCVFNEDDTQDEDGIQTTEYRKNDNEIEESSSKTFNCPMCMLSIEKIHMNDHINKCLTEF